MLYTGSYNYKLFSGGNNWSSGIANLSFKSDFTYYANPKFTARFGAEIHGYYINPGKLLVGPLTALFPTIDEAYSRQSVLYANVDYQLSEQWIFKAGLRRHTWANLGPTEYISFAENYQPQDTLFAGRGVYHRYDNIDPRLSVQHQLSKTSTLKLSYGMYHQYLQLISNSVSPFTSFEVWLPSSPTIKPQFAHQWSVDFLKYFPAPEIALSGAVFYKKMGNQIDYEPHAQTLLNPLVEGELRFGKTKSYGLELMLKKDLGKLTGWLSYTWSRALRQTPDVNGGRQYPAFQDRPHEFSLLLNYQINRRILWSAYWTSYTGSAFSSPTGFYTFNDQTVPVYGEKNNDRLPDYHRLDLAFKFLLNKNPENRYQHSLTFSVYNFLAHKNIVAVNFNKIENENGGRPIVKADYLSEEALVPTQADLIRFFPSLTYKFKF